VTRFQNGGNNNNCYIHRALQVNDTVDVSKLVNGTLTQLDDAAQTPAAAGVVKGESDGSTIKTYYDAAEKVSVTDTDITGHTRCGIYGYRVGGGTPTVDDFEAADLAVAAGNPWYAYAQQ
jgi:hypothetical protein